MFGFAGTVPFKIYISAKLPSIAKLWITNLEHAMPKPTINDARPPLALVCVFPLR